MPTTETMCPTCSSFRETSFFLKGEEMGQLKKLSVAKLMCRCLDRNTRLYPQKQTIDFFLGQITLVQLCTLHLLMDFPTGNNLLFPNGGLDSIFHLIYKKYFLFFIYLKKCRMIIIS